MNLAKVAKWLAIIIASVVALTVTTIISLLIVSSFHTSQNKKHLQSAYNKISVPSSMTLTSSNWTGGNFDTADYWSYEYTSNNPAQSTQEFKSSVMSAGYTISQPSTKFNLEGTYVATNNSLDTRIRFIKLDNNIRVSVFRASINRDYP